MRKMLITCAAALGALIGFQVYRLSKGVPVEPVVVADFNNDGKDDIIYAWSWGTSANLDNLTFVNGDCVKKGEGGYLRQGIGSCIRGAVIPQGKVYDVTASDVDGDGYKDLVMRDRNLNKDPLLYANVQDVFLGDGKGNFEFSKGFSSPKGE